MKVFLFFFYGFFQLILFAQNSEEINLIEKKAFKKKYAIEKNTKTARYDIVYHHCLWKIDPSIKYIAGTVTTYFKANQASNELNFDCSDSLVIDSIHYHNQWLTFQVNTNNLAIQLPQQLINNQLDSIQIFYHGIPTSAGLGAFQQNEHGPNHTPIIWTLSEPYGAMEWWPCKQDLNDKIDSVLIQIQIPNGNKAASNGKLINILSVGNEQLYTWKTNYPIATYLIGIAVTNYSEYSFKNHAQGIDYDVINYIYPEDSIQSKTQLNEINSILNLYDSLLIPYPFHAEKYGHAQFGWGGGIEHQTMSFCYNFNFSLIAHECAHQWFGDYITCGSWQDIWLNEGFATFMEGLSQQHLHPENWYNWKATKIKNITSIPIGTVICSDTNSVSRIFDGRLTYNKGAYVLHMLRWKLDDSLFFLALKNYLNDPSLRYSYAKTNQLLAHFNAVSSTDLTEFFNQWIYSQGYPSFQLNWKIKGNKLQLDLNQITSDPTVTFFKLPVPIHLKGKNQDTLIRVEHIQNHQLIELAIPFPIEEISIDPDLWLLSANNLVIGSTEDFNDQTQIKFYPNPATSLLQIDITNLNQPLSAYQLFDNTGKLIQTSNFEQNSQHHEINLAILEQGIYTIQFKLGESFVSYQFVKF